MMDNKAQGSMFLYLMIFMILVLFVLPIIGQPLGEAFGYLLEPLIGFDGRYPVLTFFFAAVIVVLLSSSLTHIFTDWKKMGESQEITKAFQKEMAEARKTGNTNRVNKLMKMQPMLMKRQTEAQGGMMKPMLFLVIFIYPIFIWLQMFLRGLSSHSFSVPWMDYVSLYGHPLSPIPGQTWLWLYLIFTIVIGQLIRQGLKLVTWSKGWHNLKEKIRPSSSY